MKRKIAELELENRKLKAMEGSNPTNAYGGSNNFANSANFSRGNTTDKNWMSFNSGGLERPTTAAAGGSNDVRRLQEELKNEKRNVKYLQENVDNLTKEI